MFLRVLLYSVALSPIQIPVRDPIYSEKFVKEPFS